MAELGDLHLTMDPSGLYREEVVTDRQVGTIRQLVPITREGAVDPSRAVCFMGQTQLVTPGGVLPLSFDIAAATLAEAVEKFGAAAQAALEETVRELEELRREAATSLVIPEPGAAAAILGPGGRPATGLPPGGGKIRLR